MDSCCFIEAAGFTIGKHKPERERDVLFTRALLESAYDGQLELYTSSLSIAECQCVSGPDGQRILSDDLKEYFKILLTSGQFVVLVQDTILVGEQARDLMWVHGGLFKGADAIHIASAISQSCEEFLTYDGPIIKQSEILYETFGLKVCKPHESAIVPPEKHPSPGPLFDPITP